jgi:hypothetical protein
MNMKEIQERNIDAEVMSAFQKDEQWLQNGFKETDPERNDCRTENTFNAALWTKKLYENQPEQKPVNSNLGNISENKPQENIFQKMKGWASENPCKAILGALLIGTGTYLLVKHLRERYADNSGERASLKRRRKIKAIQETETEISKEESGSPVTGKEIAIGIAAAAGGALVGTVLNDYAFASSVPVAVIGIAKNNISIIAVAFGLALSGALRDVFQSFSGTDKKEKEMKEKGFVKTMLGYCKPDKTGLLGS